MNKKLISILSVMTVMMATPATSATHTQEGGPNSPELDTNVESGYYLPDTEYIGAATQTYLGERYADNNAVFDLLTEYTEDIYKVNPGYYLPADSEGTTKKCDNGFYCPGSTEDGFTFSTSVQGLTKCPDEFENSDRGAKSEGECYRTCLPSEVANAETVTGNHYKNGRLTCSAETCVDGWHIKEAESFGLKEKIGEIEGSGSTANKSNGESYSTYIMSNDIISGIQSGFAIDYGTKGIVKGVGKCSTKPGTLDWGTGEFSTEKTLDQFGIGQYCYCNVTGYIPKGGEEQLLTSSYVFSDDTNTVDDCEVYCAYNCANHLRIKDTGNIFYRSTLFKSAVFNQESYATCEKNNYKLHWQDADGNTIVTTNPEYGGSIISPEKAPEKRGYRFRGWLLQKLEPTTK